MLLITTAGAMADDNPLPIGQDVPIALAAGGSASFEFPNLTGATLTVRLNSGDVDVSMAGPDQTSSSHSSLSGSSTSTISFQSGAPGLQLQLASGDGADLVLNVAPEAGGGAATSITTTGSSSSVTTSNSSVSVSRQVTVSGGGSANVSGSQITIDNGQVSITSGP